MTPTDALVSKFILVQNSTCFGWFLYPPSGVGYCTFSTGTCYAGLTTLAVVKLYPCSLFPIPTTVLSITRLHSDKRYSVDSLVNLKRSKEVVVDYFKVLPSIILEGQKNWRYDGRFRTDLNAGLTEYGSGVHTPLRQAVQCSLMNQKNPKQNSDHTPKIPLNNILPSIPSSSKHALPFRFFDSNFVSSQTSSLPNR
jgi:hypothetical protein